MKKQMRFMVNKMLLLRSLLTIFCVVAVFWGVSFVSHADEKGTITGSNVNLRAEASTTSTAIEVLSANALVDVLAETTGTDGNKWYKITTAAGNTGYVRADFVKKAVITVPVTDVEDKTAYIAGANANIRQDASTSSGRVANALGGSKVTIIGEATGADGYKWYQVEFTGNGTTMTGFIRSDLVTFEAPVQDPEVTVIEGETGEGSEPSEPAEEPSEEASEPVEEPSEEPSEEPEIPVTSSVVDLTIMEPVSVVEILPQGFEQTELKLGDNVYTVWGKDDFYIMYASVNGGTPQYYLYDAANESYVSYTGLLTEADMNVQPEEEGLNFKLIAIICIGIIVILALVIGILGFKLANAGYRDDDDDDDYYDDDDDDEDEEEYVSLSDDDDEEDDDDDIFDFGNDEEEDDIMNIIPITEQMPVHEIAEVPAEEAVYEEPVYEAPVEEAVYEEAAYEAPVEEAVYEEPVYEAPVEEAVYEEAVYEAPAEEAVYEESVYETPVEEPVYEEAVEYSDDEEDMIDGDSLEEEPFEEEEEYVPSKKTKKDKKEKKKFGKRILDFFTVEVEEEDEDDDDYDDEEDEDESENTSSIKRFDDDDDDLNFIDL